MTDVDPVIQAIERHEHEIAALKAELRAMRDGQAKKDLEAEIAQRIADLETDIKLQQLQDEIDKDATAKRRKRRWLRK